MSDRPLHMRQVPPPIRAFAGFVYFRLMGWGLVGEPENIPPKAVIIGAPHTTNYDGLVAVMAGLAHGVRFRWLGKQELFRFPYGWLMRLVGGLAVDRQKSKNLVEQIADYFASADTLYIIVTPEGTRQKADYWKSGFYYMALEANVPIVLGKLRYDRKQVDIWEVVTPSGDIQADMAIIREAYGDVIGKYPERKTEVILKPDSTNPS